MVRRWYAFTLVFLFVTVAVLPARAQETAGQETSLTRRSNRAVVFTLDALNLETLEGGIGAKVWTGRSTALRGSLSFGVSAQEIAERPEFDGGRSEVQGGLTFMVEHHMPRRQRVSPYLGAGFGLRAQAYSESFDYPLGSDVLSTQDKGSALRFAALAAFGVEYRLTRAVSLGGEYTLEAAVRVVNEEKELDLREEEDILRERKITAFDLGLGTSRLFLSVYF